MSTTKKKINKQLVAFRKVCKKPLFAKSYIIISLSVLLITTCYWAILSSSIHASNADQLVNVFLFERADTFSGALLPDQHTFLFKWPLLLVVKLCGSTALVFTVTTVAITLLTVGLLAYILYRIERRPLIFATLCLALASALLLVPTQPYAGAILPVNMAMLTTRNLEYVVFIASMIFVSRAPRWQSWQFIIASLLMTLLIASDKLFLSVSIGGAVVALVFYVLIRNRSMVRLVSTWLAVCAIGAMLAIGMLWLINVSGITHISAGGSTVGPYGLVQTGKDFVRGVIYLILSLLSIVGASPITDPRLLSTFPNQLATNLLGLQGIGFIVNGIIGALGLAAIGQLILRSTRSDPVTQKKPTKATIQRNEARDTSILLIWSTAAACGAYVISDHYYPVDARYVGMAVFTIFISLATMTSYHRLKRPDLIVFTGAAILVAILMSIGVVQSNYTNERIALSETNGRDALILEALKHHPVDTLLGDYWRVLPTKLASTKPLTVTPMADCTGSRDILSSKTWQLDIQKHSFAYILTLDQSLTGYPPCSLPQITAKYGQPNRSVVVAGTIKQPKELLLFYDKGINHSVPKASHTVISTVTPTAIESVPHTDCSDSTIMNIVAHQDDDLLFMNPDLQHAIDAGHCIRTVYITSGDSGTDKYYWLGREKGSEAAYSSMAGLPPDTIWIERIVKLPSGQFIVIANPKGYMKLSLIFMHLPDGNIAGQGFELNQHESLSRLEAEQIPILHTADHQSTYSSSQLTETLTTLMQTYQPDEIRTQSNVVNEHYADHSDHMTVGRYAKRAYDAYTSSLTSDVAPPPLAFYIGYPVHSLEPNVSGDDLAKKQDAFFNYAHFDGGVCGSVAQCAHGTVYNIYLNRQYTSTY